MCQSKRYMSRPTRKRKISDGHFNSNLERNIMRKALLILFSLMLSGHLQGELKSSVLKMSLPPISLEEVDPAKIVYSHQYILLENLYRPLVEMDVNGQIVPGIASKFEFDGNKLIFTFREGAKTASGKPIKAQDAAFSLKRLFIFSTNTHGDLKSLICPNQNIKKISDKCSGIEVINNKLILTFDGPKTFILPMLTSIDFAIIPESSVDKISLQIVDYRNTSGPWYLDSFSKEKAILKVNKNHYYYSKEIPKKVEIFLSNDDFELFKANKIDLIPTVNRSAIKEVIHIDHEITDTDLHQTTPIKLSYGVFTSRGMSRLSRSDRMHVAKKVREVFSQYSKDSLNGYTLTDRFFPQLGEGDLSKDQHKKLTKAYESFDIHKNKLNKKVKVGIFRFHEWKTKLYDLYDKSQIANFGFEVINGLPSKDKYSDIDFYLIEGDTGFFESITLLSYYSSVDNVLFGDSTQSKKFIETYVKEEIKSKRLRLLRDVHFEMLSSYRVVPLAVRPYIAISRNGWKLDHSRFFANFPLWLVTKKN